MATAGGREREILAWVQENQEVRALYDSVGYAPDLGRALQDATAQMLALFPADQPLPANPLLYEQLLDQADTLLDTMERDLSCPRLLACLRSSPRAEQDRQQALHDITDTRLDLMQRRRTRREDRIAVRWTWDLHSLGALLLDEENDQKMQLDQVILGPFRSRFWRGLSDGFTEDVLELLPKYLNTPWMQTPWLTTYLMLHVLDADMAARPDGLASVQQINRWVFQHPLAAYVMAGVAMAVLFLLLGHVAWVFIAALYGWWCLQSVRADGFAAALRAVRTEVASGLYDGEALAERLRRCEEKGLYVHSLLYPLFRLGTPTQAG